MLSTIHQSNARQLTTVTAVLPREFQATGVCIYTQIYCTGTTLWYATKPRPSAFTGLVRVSYFTGFVKPRPPPFASAWHPAANPPCHQVVGAWFVRKKSVSSLRTDQRKAKKVENMSSALFLEESTFVQQKVDQSEPKKRQNTCQRFTFEDEVPKILRTAVLNGLRANFEQ